MPDDRARGQVVQRAASPVAAPDAESFATKVRLALVAPGTRSKLPAATMFTSAGPFGRSVPLVAAIKRAVGFGVLCGKDGIYRRKRPMRGGVQWLSLRNTSA